MTYGGTSLSPNSTGNYFGYDNMGRATTQFQLTGSTPTKYKMSYGYNLAGLAGAVCPECGSAARPLPAPACDAG